MRIAISATGDSLEAPVDFRFGRCPFFVIVDVENNEISKFEAIRNPAVGAFGGAGIQAAQLIANRGVNVVITGNIGPNAFSVLTQTGIKVVTGVGGIKVRDAVEMYMRGELKESTMPTRGFGPGFGRGFGRGRGFGMGGI